MKASVRYTYCYPEQIQVLDIAIPEPKANEIRVKVMATTVNRTDVGVLTGKPYLMRAFAGFPKPTLPVTGTDFAGIIDKVGSEVKTFKVGDRVWGFGDNGIAPMQHTSAILSKMPFCQSLKELIFLKLSPAQKRHIMPSTF
ncbi:alcohol dehydrogenase catalytic domain-containing protein [Algoriphagus boritolerans]|uniref:alcohol dehydrogenase catalytic domain-containing protein n=1 Tax=Algoriphagus boritolerans TaxID=308111 RepID=UPI002FCDE730